MRKIPQLILACLFSFLVSCESASSSKGIEVRLLLPEEVTQLEETPVVVEIENNSGKALELNRYTLSIPSLVFEFRNSEGDMIHSLPPPVPDSRKLADGIFSLPPGESIQFEYTSLGISRDKFQGEKVDMRFYLEENSNVMASDWQRLEFATG